MATVTIAYNHSRDPMSPGHLADQIASALSLAVPPNVDINPTQIIVSGTGVTAGNTAAIQALIGAYVFDSTWIGAGVEASLRNKARQALMANDTFLAIANPTAAQVAAQAKLLTRECSALIRLTLGQLDTMSGT